MSIPSYYFLVFWMLLLSCSGEGIQSINSPTGRNASLPHLIKGNDSFLYMSWVEEDTSGTTSLWYAKMKNGKWTNPSLIAAGDNWFVNWADYPMIAIDKQGNMIAHYLVKSAPDTYAYDVNVRIKPEGGRWSNPIIPHGDGTKTEHGFVTLLPLDNGAFRLAWLDGRNTMGGGHHSHTEREHSAMTLRTAIIDLDGNVTNEVELDNRICDCCQTGGAITESGTLFVYRNRSEEEVRDVYSIYSSDGQWSSALPVGSDNWQINGCPVNGPSVSTFKNHNAVGWFTAVEMPTVKLSFAQNSSPFTDEVVIDDTNPLGRVDVVLLNEEMAVISWLDNDSVPQIKCRQVKLDGSMTEPVVISETSAARGSGFPQMEVLNGDIYFAWTVYKEGGNTSIKMAKVNYFRL